MTFEERSLTEVELGLNVYAKATIEELRYLGRI